MGSYAASVDRLRADAEALVQQTFAGSEPWPAFEDLARGVQALVTQADAAELGHFTARLEQTLHACCYALVVEQADPDFEAGRLAAALTELRELLAGLVAARI